MNRSELLEGVLALLRDLEKARDSDSAAADFSCRKQAVLQRVHRVTSAVTTHKWRRTRDIHRRREAASMRRHPPCSGVRARMWTWRTALTG